MRVKCFKKRILSDYYYGGIEDTNIINEIEHHISNCSKCRNYLNSLVNISNIVPKVDIGNKIFKQNRYFHNQLKIVEFSVYDKEDRDLDNIDSSSKVGKKNWYYTIASIAAVAILIFSIALTNLHISNNTKNNKEAYAKDDTELNSFFDFITIEDFNMTEFLALFLEMSVKTKGV